MKGKHGISAAARQAVQTRDAEIETYRNAVVRLTAERNEGRAKLAEQRQAAAKVERELRARLAEGASPQVEALNLVLAEERKRSQKFKSWYHQVNAGYGEVLERLAKELQAEGVEIPRGAFERVLIRYTKINGESGFPTENSTDESPVAAKARRDALNGLKLREVRGS